MMISYKNKSTGKIYTKIRESFSFGSEEKAKILLATSSAATLEVTEDELNKDFDAINITTEYERVWPMIKKFGITDRVVQNLFSAFLRRAQDSYYNVGDYVILLDLPGGIRETDRRFIYDYDPVIYVISKIEPLYDSYRGDQLGNRLVVARPTSKERNYDMFEFTMYPDRIVQGDAFTCVRRLDMPF